MKSTIQIPRQIDFGYRNRTIRTQRAVALRFSARSVAINSILAVVAVTVAVLSLGIGDYPLTTAQVVQSLFGQGDDFHRLIVTEWRLPIAIAAILFGALLGIGGAIFQSLTRNPLGSPDVIGFDAGSYTAVVFTILVIGANQYWYIAAAALVGGLLTAIVVYLLSYRGGVQGFRLIIVGIGVSAMLGSINAYLITQGVNASVARPLLLILGVATTALVTAAAGPIGFVALSAPQLARRLTRTPGVTVASAAFMGAALLSLAQLLSLVIAQVYRPVPVGLITVSLGGLYLIWLLIRETRRSI